LEKLAKGQIIVGILLFLTGLYSLTLSVPVGIGAILFGAWTAYTGFRLKRGYDRMNSSEDED